MDPRGSEWPVQIGATRGSTAATLVWRFRDRVHVSVVLKATFAIQGSALSPVDPDPIATHEQPYAAGLYSAGDVVPYRWKADVLVTGHVSAGATAAYLGLARDDEVLIDKAVSLGAAAGERVKVAGLGPLAASWPVRRRLLGDIDPAVLAGPCPSLPEQLDATYFQAAPADQRVDRLRGDERLVLEIEGAGSDGVDACLPGARGVAWMYGRSPALASGRALPLVMDTVHVDLDRRVVTLVWRGFAPLPTEEEPSSLRVIGRIEIVVGTPKAAAREPPRKKREPSKKPTEETIGLDADSIARMMAKAATPFERDPPAPSPTPKLLSSPRAPKKPVEETIGLDAGAVALMMAKAATPFEPGRELGLGDHFLLGMGLPLETNDLVQRG